jgi:hypothetical protein
LQIVALGRSACGSARLGAQPTILEADLFPLTLAFRIALTPASQAMMSYMDAALMASDIYIFGIEVRLQSYIRPTSAVLQRCVAPMKFAERSLN